jgi:hypothetical protein
MDTLIYLALSNSFLTLLIAGLAAALIAIARKPDGFTRANVAEALLAYFVLFAIGISYLYNFVMHSVFGEMTAQYIGWADSPFQLEVAFASLGFAAVGFYAFKNTLSVRLAAILGPALFLWGAAGVHLYEMITAGNFAPGNAGSVFYTDIISPIIGFALVWFKCTTMPPREDDSAVSRANATTASGSATASLHDQRREIG